MQIAILILSILLTALVAAGLWQHFRYRRIRRQRVDDRQPLFYSPRAFHAVTYLKVGDGRSVIDEVSALRDMIEGKGGGIVVYAGRAAMTMVESEQISDDWDAIVLAQYPSREAFERFREGKEHHEVMARFADSYTHGAVRPAPLNLALPLGLLALRLGDVLRRRPRTLPYVPVGDEAMPKLKIMMKKAEGLDRFRDLKDDAVVIFNLIEPGTSEQQKADRAYAREMMSGMAEGAYGPMHMARAMTVEGNARFRQFVAVYYPGIDHIQAMLGSTFMNRIGSGKQLGDSLAVATIPILSKLSTSQRAPAHDPVSAA